ncbi:hypothetical protein [Pantoea anthophila]|uniref:hypothetical protein n=1 Tax=Pantoea anthophila TaxID=470931 RepID=UPI0027846906|nr:hypothetical protein [Pantoea anthophila]MDQ1215011.1 hypothetical protein [Pantoea anthophila]
MKKAISEDMKKALSGIKEGRVYTLRGDKLVGLEINRDCLRSCRPGKTCRSLAPLMRRGFIEFSDVASDTSRFYKVKITEMGLIMLSICS